MAGQWKPVADHTFLWNTAHTTYKGSVVIATSTANQLDNPSGTIANDLPVGIAQEDVGPAAFGPAINAAVVDVQVFGTAACYGKGTINAGSIVTENTAVIALIPQGSPYTSNVNVWPVLAASQTAGGSAPKPAIGRAMTAGSADGDIIYVDLLIGMMW